MRCEQSKKNVLQLQMFPKDHKGVNVVIVPKIGNLHLTHKTDEITV